MDEVAEADRVFALYLGSPENPDAIEIGRRLRLLNTRDEFTQWRVRRELARFLDGLLGESKIWVA